MANMVVHLVGLISHRTNGPGLILTSNTAYVEPPCDYVGFSWCSSFYPRRNDTLIGSFIDRYKLLLVCGEW